MRMSIGFALLAFLAYCACLPCLGAHHPDITRHSEEYWRELAERGDVDDVFALGLHYLDGWDLLSKRYFAESYLFPSENYPKAKKYLTRAAEQGHVEAMYTLGRILGREKDWRVNGSAAWLKKAAEAGNPRAQYQYGRLCERGLSPDGKSGAEYWYRRASRQGFLPATRQLGGMVAAPRNVPDTRKKKKPVYSKEWNGKDLLVIYINGIKTEDKDFERAKFILRELFAIDGYGEHIAVKGVYNKTSLRLGVIDDLGEAAQQKFSDKRTPEIKHTVEELRRKTLCGLESNLEVVLVGHSQGNLFIHNLLSDDPLLATRIHVVALGSPTRTIPSPNVDYIVEANDLVAWIGGVTKDLSHVPAALAAALKQKKNPVQIVRAFIEHKAERERSARYDKEPSVFINPWLYPSTVLMGGVQNGRFFRITPIWLISKVTNKYFGIAAAILKAWDSIKAHDVIKSYLAGPGLECFREALYSIAGIAKTPKSPLPPPSPRSYIDATVDARGKGIEGYWLQSINAKRAGIFQVGREDGKYFMKKVQSMPGAWMPYQDITDIRLNNDEWRFVVHSQYGEVEHRLIRQTPDVYGGFVNHNENRWERTKSPWAGDPLPDDMEELLKAMEVIAKLPPLEITRETASAQDPETAAPATKPSAGGRVVAVNPRGIVGTWLCHVEEAVAGAYAVRYDGKAKAHSIEAVKWEGVNGSPCADFRDIRFSGLQWNFTTACVGVASEFRLAREKADIYSGVLVSDGGEEKKTRWTKVE